MESFNPKGLQKQNFSSAIRTCKNQMEKFKKAKDEVRAKKYDDMLKELLSAQKKLDKAIEDTRKIEIVIDNTQNPPKKENFYNLHIKGNDATVSLEFLETKLDEEQMAGKTEQDANLDTETNDVELKVDFVDRFKQAFKNLVNGKGLSNGLCNACIGIAIAELGVKGVSSYLVKKGAIKEATDLLGLLKYGITNIPSAWSAICGGFAALLKFSPVILSAGAALALFKLVPAIKRGKDKIDKNMKDANELSNSLENLVKGQKEHTF